MPFRCSQCGYENSPDYRFCGMCGAPLEPPPARAPEAATPPHKQPAPVSGPSFLGLADEPRRNLDYLLQDEAPRSSHWRLYLSLVLLVVSGFLLWARWHRYGYPWAALSSAKPAATSAQTSAAPTNPPAATPQAPSSEMTNAPAATPQAPSTETSNAPAAAVAEQADKSKEPAPPAQEANLPGSAPENKASAAAPPASTQTNKEPAHSTQTSDLAKSAPKPEVAEAAASPQPTVKKDKAAPAASASKSVPAPAPSSSGAEDQLVAEGEKYLYGNGVPENCNRAMTNLTKAANRYNAKARTLLGAMYATGHCAPRDLPTAYRWFALALRLDHSNARIERDLEILWRQMDAAERQRAISLTQALSHGPTEAAAGNDR